jgi:glycosyltransferase involved in cell wall biosynthesis
VSSIQPTSSPILVSVIIPAYNQSDYLGIAIQSVLDQTYQDIEILVIDDGSTDDTGKVAKRFSDPRIKYIYQANKGLSGARNTGIRNSVGEYLTFLDSDDLFLPEKINILVSFLNSQPEIGLVAGQAVPIDEHGQRIGSIFDTPIPEDSSKWLIGNPLHVGSVMLRRSWQEKIGFFDESLRSYEDWDMWLRLAISGCRMGWVAKPVSMYRFHPEQMVRNSAQMTNATFAVLEKTYQNPDLPRKWHELRDDAYSSAHLRAAMQAYYHGDYESGKANLSEAAALNPALVADNAKLLAARLAAYADSPKNPAPVKFLDVIYRNLPENFSFLLDRRNQDIGQAAVRYAFEAYQDGKMAAARQAFLIAIRYQPKWLANRGVISLFSRSLIRSLFKSPYKTNESGSIT